MENCLADEVLSCLNQMQKDCVPLDAFTISCSLTAGATTGDIERGQELHVLAVVENLETESLVSNGLVDYHKGQEIHAETVRESLEGNKLVGYAHYGHPEAALELLTLLQHHEVMADELHYKMSEHGPPGNDILLGNALIEMYAKCGFLTRAQRLLMELPMCNVISWTSLMGGSMRQCEGSQIWNCFGQLQHEGLFPDAALFSCMLSACSRLHLVEAAEAHFVDMHMNYGIKPDLMHYTCLVDAFGRGGHLERAATR
ncbi:hypothetical protein KP509_1Z208100 [Ceratopteris richardii]|nr:hypothetical protein KP509_1Z208100 [Ceratopteris richardii]